VKGHKNPFACSLKNTAVTSGHTQPTGYVTARRRARGSYNGHSPLARERPRFRSSCRPMDGKELGWKPGRHKALRVKDTSLKLSVKGPAKKKMQGNARRV